MTKMNFVCKLITNVRFSKFTGLLLFLHFSVLAAATGDDNSSTFNNNFYFKQTNLLETTFGTCPQNFKKPQKKNNLTDKTIYSPPELDEIDSNFYADKTFSSNPNLDSITRPKRNDKNISRIAIWGDSHSGLKSFTDAFTVFFESERSKNIPSQLIPASLGIRGAQVRVTKQCISNDWGHLRFYSSLFDDSQSAPISGVSMRSRYGFRSYIWVELEKTIYGDDQKEIYLLFNRLKSPPGTKVRIKVNDSADVVLDVDKLSNDLVLLKTELGLRFFKIEVISGFLEIYGFIQSDKSLGDRSIDVFNIPGATFKSWSKNLNTEIVERGLIQYDLIVFQFGTNEANSTNFSVDDYRKEFRRQLDAALKIFPDTACVLITPPDRGVLIKRVGSKKISRGKRDKITKQELLKYSTLHSKISKIQQEEGSQRGCLVWDWQAAMGGIGSAYTWFHSKPRLMSADLTHLTVDGYQRSSQELSKWLRNIFVVLSKVN